MCQISWGAASDLIEIRVDMGHSIKTAAGRTYAPFVPSPNPNLKGLLFCLFLGNRDGSRGFETRFPRIDTSDVIVRSGHHD